MDCPSDGKTIRLEVQAAIGNKRALATLVQRWRPRVVRWCRDLGGPRVDAEDAAHDVFAVALRKLSDLKDPDRFGSWLFGITRRVLRQHRRQSWNERRVPDVDVAAVADPAVGPEAISTTRDLMRRANTILIRLPPLQRQVFILCVVEQRTLDETAVLLDIARGTAASRLRLARQRFDRQARSLDSELDPKKV